MKLKSDYSEYYKSEDKTSNFDIKEFVLKYVKYWPYFFVSLVLALGIAYLKNKFTHPEYKVESKFFVKEENNNLGILDLTGVGGNGFAGPGPRLVNESIILKSKPIAEETLARLDFDVEYFRTGTFINTEIYDNTPIKAEVDWAHSQLVNGEIKVSWTDDKRFTLEFPEDGYEIFTSEGARNDELVVPVLNQNTFLFGEWVTLPFSKFKLEHSGLEKEGELILKFRSKKYLISYYSGENLQIWPIDQAESSILGLSLITNQPEKGRDYLNTLMEVHLENELEEKNALASKTVDFIDAQVSGVADSLNFIEHNLENFRSNNRTYNIGEEGNTIFNQLSELERTLSQEQFKRDYYQNLENYLVREEYNEILMPSGLGIEDPILNTLLQNLILLQSEKSRFLATQTDAHPAVKEVTRKITDLNSSIREVLNNVNRNVNFSINDLKERISKIESEFRQLPATEQNLLRIQRKFTLNENIYTFLLQRRAESAIAMASNTASNKIIEFATPNYQPLSLNKNINYAVALVAGVSVPFFLLLFFNLFNVKIKEVRETEEKLSVPTLTHIGHNSLRSELVVLKESKAGITEAFRTLRTNIYFITPKNQKVTIAVTSSISGEGKSFCGVNLAAAYSLNGKKTLLIDCDLHKPKDYKAFNLSHSKGLSTYLSSQSNAIFSLIQKTAYENLEILRAGPIPPNPGELLLKDRFEIMLTELKQMYDIIILDTPPVGLVSETRELMRLSDLTLYVIRYNVSNKSVIHDINYLRKKMGMQNLYTVFNDVEEKELNYGGYGYGYYTDDHKKRSFFKKVFGFGGGRAAM